MVTSSEQQKINYLKQKVSIDSRYINPRGVFIAIRGGNNDGHDYINQAIDNGAEYIIVDDNYTGQASARATFIKVADTFKALHQLAQARRATLSGKIIAITGSVGKTTVRELLLHALTKLGYKASASIKNYNNHYGVPLTICNFDQGDDFYILEIGINHSQELLPLATLAQPDYAVITTIEPAHIGNFTNFQQLVDEKWQISLPADKTFVDNKVALPSYEVEYTPFTFSYDANSTNPALSYNKNLALLLLQQILKRDISEAIWAGFTTPQGRGNIIKLMNDITIIDDSYNASPCSTINALKTLQYYQVTTDHRRVAIIGDMLELGEDANNYHQQLNQHLATIDTIITVGTLANNNIASQYKFVDHHQAYEFIKGYIQPKDVILCKGSFSVGLHKIVAGLIALDTPPDEYDDR
jgi:UDP-N-acetylmuramoyl-tripeptide--D-alanyl-D-alanine ligase